LRVNLERLARHRSILWALSSSYGLMTLSIAIQFVLVPLYLQHLGKESFGILTMLLAAINYGSVGITWLSGGMARILGERSALSDTAGFTDAYAFSKVIYCGYAAITICLFWIASPWILAGAMESQEMSQVLVLASIYFLLMYEYNTDRLAFIALCRQATGNSIDAAGQIAFACGVAAGLYFGGGLSAIVGAQILGVLVARILAWLYWYRDGMDLHWKWPLMDPMPMWKRIGGKMGRHYVLYGVLLLTLQADVLVVGWLAGPKVAATFYLLWRIPEVCILLLGRIPGVFSPHLIQMEARGETGSIQIGYRQGLHIMLGLSALAGCAYAVAGNWFVHLWVGDSAPGGFFPYAVAGAALFFVAASQWPAGAAYALVRTGPLVKVATLQLVGKMAILLLLFGSVGYLAPVIAIVLTHLFGVFFLYLKIGKQSCSNTELTGTQKQAKDMFA
jgi:O-antigen/teichoic acid export membrane protein